MATHNIIQWNCRGIKANREDIELIIQKYSPAAICLQETLLKPNQKPTFKHYTAYYKSTINGHGGVCILVKNSIIQSQIIFQADIQAVAVCISIEKKSYTIASVYAPPSESLKEQAIKRMIDTFASRYLILGDFNAHHQLWGATNNNDKGITVQRIIDNYNLCNLNVTQPTRFDTYHHTSSLIDLSLCHPSIYLDLDVEVLSDARGSDHYPILVTATASGERVPERPPKWNFKKANWPTFREQCLKELTYEILEEDPENDKMKVFSRILLETAVDNIPQTSPFPKQKAKPWFDEQCKEARKKRTKANREARNSSNNAYSMRARLIRAQTRKVFRAKKRASWQKYVSSINVNTPINKVWNMIRKINGKNVASPMHHLKDTNGQLITDKVEIANTLGAAVHKSSSSANYSKEFQSIKKAKEKHPINFKTTHKYKYNKSFRLSDLKRSLKKSNNSSPGIDQIHYEILRHLPDKTLKVLLKLINKTWQSETFPQSWREALVISIPKPGKDHYNALNYRPIALTSCICKTVERMVNERLVWYLEKNGLLAKQQCGYRAGRCTTDHLVRLETFVRDAFIKNQHLVAVFFDLQKAYDTTWKTGILQDLHDMGLRGCLPKFIENFFTDRTFHILLGNILSKEYEQEEGVPQGAILSTTLFNIKINDIVNQVDPEVECSLYVDDFVIMYTSPTIDGIERKLQCTINKLEKWTMENGFTFSQNKTVAMHFCPDKKCPDPELTLYKKPIEFVKETKFLGLIWDSKLTFEPHIRNLKARCYKAMNILKVLATTGWGADSTTMMKLYRSLIRSKIDYGSIVYGSAANSVLDKLDPAHNQGIRLSLGAFCSSPVESLYVEANEPPLQIRRDKLLLQYVTKLSANPNNPAYDAVFHPKYRGLYKAKASATNPLGIYAEQLLDKAEIDTSKIAIYTVPEVPVWDSEPVIVDFALTEFSKSSTSSQVFNAAFNELKEKYKGYCELYTDGSKHNSDVACAVVSDYGTRSFKLPDSCSIFTAEIEAIYRALAYVKLSRLTNFIIYSDSLSVLQALDNQVSRNPLVHEVLSLYHEILNTGKCTIFCWIPSHRGIPGNELADSAAKQALQKNIIEDIEIPSTDLFTKISPYVSSNWQERWDNQGENKLRCITPEIIKYYPGCRNRRDEVIIHRLRIGHTRYTQSYLLENLPIPICHLCTDDAVLSVKHMLIECDFYDNIRQLYYHVDDMMQLFEEVSDKKIIDFIKHIGLYNSI